MIFLLGFLLLLSPQPTPSQQLVSSCPAGLYLLNGVCQACIPDTYCEGGSSPSRPCSQCDGISTYKVKDCSLTMDAICLPCTQCAAGTYVSKQCNLTANAICASCINGTQFCLGNLAPMTPCSPCVVGNGVSLIQPCMTKSDTVCFTCQPGFLCPNPPIALVCPAGFACNQGKYKACSTPGDLCPPGSSVIQDCPAGFYCSDPTGMFPCAVGFFCPPRTQDFTKFPCAKGTVCLEGSSAPSACVAGNVCPDIATQLPCPVGYFCPPSTYDHTLFPCSTGSFCGGGAAYEPDCPPGWFCDDPTVKAICPAGSACGPRSIAPTPCQDGSTCLEGTGYESDCPGGYFCITPATPPTLCPAGYQCLPRSQALGPPCADGTRCPAGTVIPAMCQSGFKCSAAMFEVCSPGEICPQGTGKQPVLCSTDGSSLCKTNTSFQCPTGYSGAHRSAAYVMFTAFMARSAYDLLTLYAISATDGSLLVKTLSNALIAPGFAHCFNYQLRCRYANPLLLSFDGSYLIAFTRQQQYYGSAWTTHLWRINPLTASVKLLSKVQTPTNMEIDVQSAMICGNGTQILVAGNAGIWWLSLIDFRTTPVTTTDYGSLNSGSPYVSESHSMFQTQSPDIVMFARWNQVLLLNTTSGVVTSRAAFGDVIESMDLSPNADTLFLWARMKLYRLSISATTPPTQLLHYQRNAYTTGTIRYSPDDATITSFVVLMQPVPVRYYFAIVINATTGEIKSTAPSSAIASENWLTYSITQRVASECHRCADVANGFWLGPDNCREIGCYQDYWVNLTATRCAECTAGIVCAKGQYYVPCARTEDAHCATCTPVPHMANWTDTLCNFTCADGFYRQGYACLQCTNTSCRNGMFREQCNGGRWLRDAKCVSCVPPGKVGTYKWTGGGCNGFNCSLGYTKAEKKCEKN